MAANGLTDQEQADLQRITGAETNPFKKEHWNLTHQLKIKDESPSLAGSLEYEAHHPEEAAKLSRTKLGYHAPRAPRSFRTPANPAEGRHESRLTIGNRNWIPWWS